MQCLKLCCQLSTSPLFSPHLQVLTDNGWLRTGDLGYLDACGVLWLCGRIKDMIKSGGENVYASEVERVLLQHDAVAAAAAVGIPHQRLGEQVSGSHWCG